MISKPFSINLSEELVADLKNRIARTRWPQASPGPAWDQGTDLGYLRSLLEYWGDGFDWRAQEAELNSFHHYSMEIDGFEIHYVHERSSGGGGTPLLLSHGWPSSFLEYLALVPLLSNPRAHGIESPGFDLVIPSLPGYLFSERPPVANYKTVARMWHKLMLALGYERYGAGGGDFGAGITTFLALEHPASLIGIYLTTPELWPPIEAESAPLSEAEKAYVMQVRRWEEAERGYSAIQSTRPQTLAYGLCDSPAGLAAWILEKWRAWGDSGGDLGGRFSADFLLSMLTLYWATGTIATSIRDYYDNRWSPAGIEPGTRVHVPTGFGNFSNSFVDEGDPPREWLERLYDVRHWTAMRNGGHFAAVEEPRALASDIAKFFLEVSG